MSTSIVYGESERETQRSLKIIVRTVVSSYLAVYEWEKRYYRNTRIA